jgi:hypothetical protein
MRLSLPAASVAAALTLATTVAGLPLAAPALAVGGGTEVEYYITDPDGDFAYELRARPTSAPGTTFLVAGDATHDIDALSFSQDGSRLVYIQRTLDSTGEPVSSQVVVRDVSGSTTVSQLVRVVSSVADTSAVNFAPTLSPDGSTVVWSNASSAGLRLYRAGVTSGSPVLVKAGYLNPVFLDATTLLAQNANNGQWATVTLAGVATANSLTPDVFDVAVSADGQHVAWALDKSVDSTSVSDIQTASLSVANGVATFGSPTTLATDLANEAPAFSVDGSKVYFVKWDGDTGDGDIYSVPADDSSDAVLDPAGGVAGDDYDVAVGTTDDGTAPAAPTFAAAVLNGSAVTVKWSFADSDASGVTLKRYAGVGTSGALQKTVPYVPGTSYVDSGLVLGSTYTYEITSIDRSGNVGTAATRSVTALLPAPKTADPTSATSAKRYFPVTFATTAPSTTKYNVDYLPVGTTTWKHWVVNATGRVRTFGVSSSTTGVASTTSTPGTSYVFRVQVKDAFGNASAFVSSARAVVPFDQGKATFSGGTTISSASSYLGSYRQLRSTSSYAKVTLTGNRLQVIGVKCAACGKFAVYAGSTKLATIDTYSSSTKLRQVLFTKTYTSVGTHTLTIRPLGTAGRPNVDLDGFAARR